MAAVIEKSKAESGPIRLQPETISLKDFRSPEKLAALDNNETVIFNPGKAIKFSAYGYSFEGTEFKSKGVVAGTDIKLPPVRLLTPAAFYKLASAAGCASPQSILAWLDPNENMIEALLPGSTGNVPKAVEMRAEDAKRLLGAILHESIHAGREDKKGGDEFSAYSAERSFLIRIGVKPEFPTNASIMEHILKNYDTGFIISAFDSFSKVASDEEYQYFSEKMASMEDDLDLNDSLFRIGPDTGKIAARKAA